MSFPNIKLTYFKGEGRAEAVRLAFFVGGIPFVDERLTREQFVALKPSLPFLQLPILEVDGEVIAQSHAMLRYAGRLSKLYPANDPLAALKIDEILTAMDEFVDKMIPSFREQDEEKKKEMRLALVQDTIPRYLKAIEARFVKLKELTYFQGDHLSILSLSTYCFVKMLSDGSVDHIPTNLFEAYPEWMAYHNKVEKHPRVKQWYEAQKSIAAPKLKLTYFPGAGRAEPTRLAFHIGGIDFEDERLPGPEIAARKATFPFGQVPILEINGEPMAQSYPILRYAGSISGLYPSNVPLDAFKVDELLSAVDELINAWSPSFYEKDEEKKKSMRLVLAETTIPQALKLIEARLNKWNGAYAVGAYLTIADLTLFNLIKGLRSGTMDHIPTTIADSYTRIISIHDKVANHPKVVEWYQTHQ